MCGIAGMAGASDSELLEEMLTITRHRGPDDRGTYLNGGIAIGCNRLKVLDLSSAGHQPMSSPDGAVWVVYNGEIFNFAALREELRADGCSFRSQSDTEVLPLLYLKYGARMVERLNGMFAFAIWDEREQKLLIARDRMGVKPLYYATAGDRLYFASEVKSLLLAPELRPELDPAALSEFLALLYVPNPGTMFRNILKLQPGCLLTWQDGKIAIDRYWDGSGPMPWFQSNEQELQEQCRAVLKDAVRRQLVSDVPIGFFLSGGLDSSALVACAAEIHSGPLRCYTIAFQKEHARMEQSGDDRSYARLVAERFGAEWHELVVDPDVTSLLPKVTWHLDDPIADPAAIATYLICREAKASATVLLSGQGADELFAGYRVHLSKRSLTGFACCRPLFVKSSCRRCFRRFPVMELASLALVPGSSWPDAALARNSSRRQAWLRRTSTSACARIWIPWICAVCLTPRCSPQRGRPISCSESTSARQPRWTSSTSCSMWTSRPSCLT